MKYILFENFSLRILSLFLAIIGWFYVNIIVNPVVDRQFEIDLLVTEKRSDCAYKNIPSKVHIILHGGRRDIIEGYYPVKLFASVNVSKAVPDIPNKIPVSVISPRGLDLLKIEPREIEIMPVMMEEKTVEVNVMPNGEVKPGYYIKEIETNPKIVKLKGPKKTISKVKQLIVPVQVSNLDSSYSTKQFLNLTETDINDKANSDVMITPKDAEISVYVQPMPSKQVNVVPSIKGNVAQGYTILSSECDPKFIMIKGVPEKISKITEINTEPIDMTNATQGIKQVVKLILPEQSGVIVENKQVSLTVTLKPIYKTQKFYNVPVMAPHLENYEITLEDETINIEANAPLFKIKELENSKFKIDAMLHNSIDKLDTGSVTLDLLISGTTVPVEIKPAQIKAFIKPKNK